MLNHRMLVYLFFNQNLNLIHSDKISYLLIFIPFFVIKVSMIVLVFLFYFIAG